MKISRTWLQTYFENPLPDMQALSDALTFHAFEIDSIEGDVLDVKVTPNRGHDCLSHRGIAKELSAILKVPLKNDPLSAALLPKSSDDGISLDIKDTERAPVAAAAYMKGVKISPSPAWLKERLEAVGQRSINNVVDATNYVMFDIGMPTHAFAAETFKDGGTIRYGIRTSKKGEKLALLGGTFVELSGEEAVIMNASQEAVDIGGVKGGMTAELNDKTTEIVLSASKFHPVHTRKAAQRFNQRTEAARRFENEMPDELAAHGIRAVAELVRDVAGGKIVAYAHNCQPSEKRTVSVSLDRINQALGTEVTGADVADVFLRLGLSYKEESGTFDVIPPFERLDIKIAEDLIEEVGRIIGYDKVPPVELPPLSRAPEVNGSFFAAEKIREELVSKGYSEVFTSVFADAGKRIVANKVDGVRPYLRANLTDGLKEALVKNTRNKDLLGLKEIRLFEIGTVWGKRDERITVGIADEKGIREEPLKSVEAQAYDDFPTSTTERYQTFSRYPFIVRDIALWTPTGTKHEDVLEIIRAEAGTLLVRSEKFDEYKNEKTGKTSFAFRLVFQSFEKTLTDEEANSIMEKVYEVVKKKGWEVR